MPDPHANSLFIQPEEGVHDGCFLVTKQRCPVEIAALNARLANLPPPPAWFVEMTARMAEIQDVPRPSVIE